MHVIICIASSNTLLKWYLKYSESILIIGPPYSRGSNGFLGIFDFPALVRKPKKKQVKGKTPLQKNISPISIITSRHLHVWAAPLSALWLCVFENQLWGRSLIGVLTVPSGVVFSGLSEQLEMWAYKKLGSQARTDIKSIESPLRTAIYGERMAKPGWGQFKN